MKAIILFLFLFSFSAQSQDLVGIYQWHYDLKNGGAHTRTLVLNSNNTFTFHNFRKTSAMAEEKNWYGKGSWTETKGIITFYTDKENDINEKFTYNFSGTKARFHTKHPRDKSNRDIPTSITFYQSNIPILKNFKIPKK